MANEPLWQSIKAGFAYVNANGNIRTQLILALGPITLALPFTNLLPIFAKDVLVRGAQLQGFLLSAFGVPALSSARWSSPPYRGATLTRCRPCSELPCSASRYSSSAFVVGLVVFDVRFRGGIFMTTYQTQDQALLQLSAPGIFTARVMSFYLVSRATVPIGTLLAGALAHYFGGPAAVQMMSLSAIGLVALVISTHPAFLRLSVSLQEEPGHSVAVD